MKKILGMFLIIALAFGIVACGDDPVDPIDPVDPDATASISGVVDATIDYGVVFDPFNGVSATDSVDGAIANSNITLTGAVDTSNAGTYTLTYKVTGSDGKEVTATRRITVRTEDGEVPEPTDIVIMHGAPYEVDPFHADFSGTEQAARQALQTEVEDRLNVNVIYRAYPASAAWGPSRITAIINASVAGEPLADLYWTTSDWVQQLADANAIVPVDQYLATTGSNIHSDFRMVGEYANKVYGFGANNLTVDVGLYYNADLVSSLGVDNPSQLYLDGDWNWTGFETWATQVQTALSAQGEDLFALGGAFSAYAESMVALNGGSLINATTGRVSFAQNPALETYTFLSDLNNQGLFEPSGTYDSGSVLWQTGKVAMHPGHLWFVTADNRWGGLAFELGFVPYPVSDTFTGDYVSPISGVAIYNVASGMTAEKEALVFQVWNELQLWKTDAELADEFELTLLTKFDDELYVEAYLDIYDSVYLELINAIGIGAYGETGWRRSINLGIREGTARTEMDRIKPIYETALEDYLN
ncbi:MAG: extracellular solute-binding protein [Acholeplasmataceae bacterium]|nr:extracellular solute-binding protein [Acholeplasmataceae bacterium]